MQILNAADPVFRLNASDVASDKNAHTFVIGDFDGDGFADLASCSVDPGATNANYSVFIFFADKNGLPATLPALGAPNYKQITFPGTSPTAMAQPYLNCIGGDFDGDGKSDVLIADPGAAGNQGNLYVLFGVADRTAPGVGIPMLANNAIPGEKIGQGQLFAGDFNGDGHTDFVTQTFYGSGQDTTYVFSWKGQPPIPRASPPPQLMTNAPTSLPAARHLSPSPQPCGTRIVQAMGNIDTQAGEEILLFDPNVNVTTAAQCPMNGFGGFTVIKDTINIDGHWVRPMMSPSNFGQSSTLCDVDGDGLADLVALDGGMGVLVDFSGPGGFANTTGSPPVLDGNPGANVAIIPPLVAGRNWLGVGCGRKILTGAAQTLALPDPGDGSTVPITINLFSNARAPMLLRAIPNPTSPLDLLFGQVFGGSGDINGDSLNDLVLGSQRGLWAMYGR
jgi:hypothetical protein